MANPERTNSSQGARSSQHSLQGTVLEQALQIAKKGFVAVAIFSFFLNLLMLATPIYMLQVFQRVLGSGHNYTLVYLTAITIFALLILGVLFR